MVRWRSSPAQDDIAGKTPAGRDGPGEMLLHGLPSPFIHRLDPPPAARTGRDRQTDQGLP